MSKAILILGESGSGKTTSLRNLPSNQTYYINTDKKDLSWKGWREHYNTDKRKNLLLSSDAKTIKTVINSISEKALGIKYIVIDTLNAIMIDDEFNRMKEKGYDKWMDLAFSIYDIADISQTLRDDLIVICLAHSQDERDDNGNIAFTHMKTSGRKLDKIVIESKFTTVLLCKCVDGKHIFEVHSKNSTAKTPLGAFDTDEIDNDIMTVIEALKEY
jgi:hypothetical protein